MQRLPATRDSALGNLNRAIAALAEHLHAPQDMADLAQLRLVAARLASAPGMAEFDPARFRHLLTLAGPTMQAALLSHLCTDLAKCGTDLRDGLDHKDWTALREGSHVLISLAGSVGALSLQAMAERLNSLAHERNLADAAALMPGLASELDALLQLVRATQAQAPSDTAPAS